MVADALIRMGRADAVEKWVDGYLPRLEDPPAVRWGMTEADAPQALGQADRVGDWCALFHLLLSEEPWTDVLFRWWPRLLPNAVISAAHPLIRTGHVVRALREQESQPRLKELAQALGYWAARWQPLRAEAGLPVPLLELPVAIATGTFRERLEQRGLAPTGPADLDALVEEAVAGYLTWGASNPTMLVHAATAPRAASLVMPSLPVDLWAATRAGARSVTATVVLAYRDDEPPPAPSPPPSSAADVTDRAVGNGDEHAIKFTEVALEASARGCGVALAAAALACDLLG